MGDVVPRVRAESIAPWLNCLPMVRWDRCIPLAGSFEVYGWIDRDDGRADFVLLCFRHDGLSVSSSSARYSAQITRLLLGNVPHTDCIPVEEAFGELVYNRVGRERTRQGSEATL